MRAAEQDRIEELEGQLGEAQSTINRLECDLDEKKDELRNLTQQFTPNAGDDEPPFRAQVRDLLDIDWSARDERIFDELRRLRTMERSVASLNSYLDDNVTADPQA